MFLLRTMEAVSGRLTLRRSKKFIIRQPHENYEKRKIKKEWKDEKSERSEFG